MKKINVTRTSLPRFEEYCAEIRKLWDTHILTNMGEEHEAFRAELERYLEVPHATSRSRRRSPRCGCPPARR